MSIARMGEGVLKSDLCSVCGTETKNYMRYREIGRTVCNKCIRNGQVWAATQALADNNKEEAKISMNQSGMPSRKQIHHIMMAKSDQLRSKTDTPMNLEEILDTIEEELATMDEEFIFQELECVKKWRRNIKKSKESDE